MSATEAKSMEWKELISKLSTPGDVAAFLLSGAAGFAVDVLLFPAGVPPGTVAGVAASAGLGAKKLLDARINARREREEEVERRETEARAEELPRARLEARARALLEELRAPAGNDGSSSSGDKGSAPGERREGHRELVIRLEKTLHLWSRGIIDDEEFSRFVDRTSREFLQSAVPFAVGDGRRAKRDYGGTSADDLRV